MNNPGKILWSVQEACAQLGIGRSTLLELTYRGTLPSVLINRRRLFPARRLLEWVEGLSDEPEDVVIVRHISK